MTPGRAHAIVVAMIYATRAWEEPTMRAHMNGSGTLSEVISLDRWAAHRAGGDGSPRILVMLAASATTVMSDEDVFGALRAGAAGFLVKDTEPVELLR